MPVPVFFLRLCLGLALAGPLLAVAGCDRPAAGGSAPTIAVSNTYLEAALQDVLARPLAVVRLAPAGTCPGHFDLRPSQMTALRDCRLLLRFDFQEALDEKLSAVATGGLRVAAVGVPGGLCEPPSYLAVCRQVADALAAAGMLDPTVVTERLATIKDRLQEETAWARRRIADAQFAGAAVVTSKHQAAFCRFLGLDVVATFSGADMASIEEVSEAIRHGTKARAIIANVPEGRRLADALAARLGAPVVVWHNFPDESLHDVHFDAMLRDNVERLVAAASP